MHHRSYTVRIAALTLDIHHKWLDNLLSQHVLPGVRGGPHGGRRGRARRITEPALLAIAAVDLLHRELGVPVGVAVEHVRRAFASDPPASRLVTASGLELELPLDALERAIQARLPDALLSAPEPARGRPPRPRPQGR